MRDSRNLAFAFSSMSVGNSPDETQNVTGRGKLLKGIETVFLSERERKCFFIKSHSPRILGQLYYLIDCVNLDSCTAKSLNSTLVAFTRFLCKRRLWTVLPPSSSLLSIQRISDKAAVHFHLSLPRISGPVGITNQRTNHGGGGE